MKLDVIAVEKKESPKKSKVDRKTEVEREFNALSQQNPEQFNPKRNAMERARFSSTLELIEKLGALEGLNIVDLGCGDGSLAKELAARGAHVEAVDISLYALKVLQKNNPHHVKAIHALIPFTSLEDDQYDIVISTEIIGFIPEVERRLYISEMARLVKATGYLICSTALDIYTENALSSFISLLETEFETKSWKVRHHALFIRLRDLLRVPQKWSHQAGWFRWLWTGIGYLSIPIAHWFEQSPRTLSLCEKICRFMSCDNGISHVIFVGCRRPLIVPTLEELQVQVPKEKRRIWE